MGRFFEGGSDSGDLIVDSEADSTIGSTTGAVGVLGDVGFICGSSFLDWLIGGCCAMPAVRSSSLLIHSLGGASYIFSDGLIAGVSGDFGADDCVDFSVDSAANFGDDIFSPMGAVVAGMAADIGGVGGTVGVAVPEFAIGAGIVVIVARGMAS